MCGVLCEFVFFFLSLFGLPNPVILFLEIELMVSQLSSHSSPLHLIPASNLLRLKFAVEVWRDTQFSALPKANHFAGEVFRELR